MSATSFDDLPPEADVVLLADLGGDEVLAMFAEVMRERGHYRTAKGLRYPTLEEARKVAVGRRTDRGWNTTPIPG